MNKKYKIIRWGDHSSDSSWKNKKEIEEWVKKPTICTTVGEVTYEDEDFIVLSASFDGDDSYGDNIIILKKCIVK